MRLQTFHRRVGAFPPRAASGLLTHGSLPITSWDVRYQPGGQRITYEARSGFSNQHLRMQRVRGCGRLEVRRHRPIREGVCLAPELTAAFRVDLSDHGASFRTAFA